MRVNTKNADNEKKIGRGRPAGTDLVHQLQMRVSAEFLAKLDDLRRQERDIPSRTEMMRRLVERPWEALKRGK